MSEPVSALPTPRSAIEHASQAPSQWPIIVGGSHRSGTTLVRRLLDSHPRIFCPPEIKFYKDLLGQFPDDPLAHGRLGSSIKALDLPTETWLDEFGRALCRCYELAVRQAGKRRWADKSPENAINAGHWDRLLEGRLAFVLVVRHPLDIIASMEEIGMDKVIPRDAAGRAAHVRDYIAMGLSFVDAHPQRSIVIRYEQLVADPRAELIRLMTFLGEDYDETMLEALPSVQRGEGLEDPKADSHRGISGDSVGRWKRELSSRDLEVARPVVEPIASRLGYDLTAGE